jgi:hypothetical protein
MMEMCEKPAAPTKYHNITELPRESASLNTHLFNHELRGIKTYTSWEFETKKLSRREKMEAQVRPTPGPSPRKKQSFLEKVEAQVRPTRKDPIPRKKRASKKHKPTNYSQYSFVPPTNDEDM